MMKGAVECADLDNENSRRAIQASQQTYPSEGLGFHQPEKLILPTDDDPQLYDQRSFNELGAREILSGHHWPRGFQDVFLNKLATIPIRYILCDNTSVMANQKWANQKWTDGSGHSKWEQLTPNLKFHASLAQYVPTEFRLLNTATSYMLGHGVVDTTNFKSLNTAFDQAANGMSLMHHHMEQISSHIKNNADRWRADQKACLIFFVDGPPVDITSFFGSLRGLPVDVVLRLCDDSTIEAWKEILQRLDVSLEVNVIFDYDREVAKISVGHPLVSYREFLHQMRESGVNTKEEECIQCATEFTLTNLSSPPQPQSATRTSKSPISGAPRLMRSICVIVGEKFEGVSPLGTAWIVKSRSGQLLLTACHCLEGVIGNLYLSRKIYGEPGKFVLDSKIPVEVVHSDQGMDIAVLKADRRLSEPIPLCPFDEYPVQSNEDRVKSYHYPLRLFQDGFLPMTAVATDYQPIQLENDSHMVIIGQHTKGSSGGVIVDDEGRAVAMILRIVRPGVHVPISDSMKAIWENINVIGEGSGTFTLGVKLSSISWLNKCFKTTNSMWNV